jgi:hypothetical protein
MAGQYRYQFTNRDIPRGTLRNILAIIGMTADELRDLL